MPPCSLVSARLAEAAAAHVMTREAVKSSLRSEPLQRGHLRRDGSNRPNCHDSADSTTPQAVLGRVVEPDGDEVEANLALWEELYDATDSAHVAWGGLLIALCATPTS